MKPLVDWVLIFFMLFILHAIATEFLFKLQRQEEIRLDRELDKKNMGIMYYFPVLRG